mmetsp:Transcript_12673/g.38170  ORF Transcript_12673/g.38170 Transcript_12673/m.38170 type:complete len:342 (+) Transcript_12673:1479-2504(+)
MREIVSHDTPADTGSLEVVSSGATSWPTSLSTRETMTWARSGAKPPPRMACSGRSVPLGTPLVSCSQPAARTRPTWRPKLSGLVTARLSSTTGCACFTTVFSMVFHTSRPRWIIWSKAGARSLAVSCALKKGESRIRKLAGTSAPSFGPEKSVRRATATLLSIGVPRAMDERLAGLATCGGAASAMVSRDTPGAGAVAGGALWRTDAPLCTLAASPPSGTCGRGDHGCEDTSPRPPRGTSTLPSPGSAGGAADSSTGLVTVSFTSKGMGCWKAARKMNCESAHGTHLSGGGESGWKHCGAAQSWDRWARTRTRRRKLLLPGLSTRASPCTAPPPSRMPVAT